MRATPQRHLTPGRLIQNDANCLVLINYDRLYIGGGNAQVLDGHVDPSVTILGNIAGVLGGIKLWDLPEG